MTTGNVYTRFDGYRTDFGEGYVTRIAIYLDPTAIAAGQGFDYSVASSQIINDHKRDFVFHVAKDTGTGKLLVGADNNTNFAVREDLETLSNHAEITTGGWYTFEHYFFKTANGTLAVAMSVYDANGDHVFTEIRNDASDIVDTNVGGNRYGWFTVNTVPNLAIDGVTVELTEPIGAIVYDTSTPYAIEGSPYDDTFLAGPGNDVIDGNDGSDTYDASSATSQVTSTSTTIRSTYRRRPGLRDRRRCRARRPDQHRERARRFGRRHRQRLQRGQHVLRVGRQRRL